MENNTSSEKICPVCGGEMVVVEDVLLRGCKPRAAYLCNSKEHGFPVLSIYTNCGFGPSTSDDRAYRHDRRLNLDLSNTECLDTCEEVKQDE